MFRIIYRTVDEYRKLRTIMAKNEYLIWYPYQTEITSARSGRMTNQREADSGSAKTKIERTEKAIGTVERIFITICLAAILLFIIWRYVALSAGYGTTILIGGIALIIVLVLIEVLLIEMRRNQH